MSLFAARGPYAQQGSFYMNDDWCDDDEDVQGAKPQGDKAPAVPAGGPPQKEPPKKEESVGEEGEGEEPVETESVAKRSGAPKQFKTLDDVKQHRVIITHNFMWAPNEAVAKKTGLPLRPFPSEISPETFAASYGVDDATGKALIDAKKRMIFSKVEIVEYDKRTDVPLSATLTNIQGQRLHKNATTSGKMNTFAMPGPSGHQLHVNNVVHELKADPEVLRAHGTVDVAAEKKQFIESALWPHMFVPKSSHSARIFSSERFYQKLAPRDQNGKKIAPAVHEDPNNPGYLKVDKVRSYAVLDDFEKIVVNRMPITQVEKHTVELDLLSNNQFSTTDKSFGDLSMVAGLGPRDLDMKKDAIQSATILIAYTILDQNDLGLRE